MPIPRTPPTSLPRSIDEVPTMPLVAFKKPVKLFNVNAFAVRSDMVPVAAVSEPTLAVPMLPEVELKLVDEEDVEYEKNVELVAAEPLDVVNVKGCAVLIVWVCTLSIIARLLDV